MVKRFGNGRSGKLNGFVTEDGLMATERSDTDRDRGGACSSPLMIAQIPYKIV